MAEKGRFAPSPSGRMHLGNVLSFLLAWLDARAAGGTVVLRMEDLDPLRTGEPWASWIADDLRWLGLGWEEGFQAGGPNGPYCQRERTALYDAAFRALEEQGLLYPCWCSRHQRLAASAPHPGEVRDMGACPCRAFTAEERAARWRERGPAWKAAVPHETVAFRDANCGPQSFHLAHDCGDFIVRRSDGVYAYQLAVTVDDARMGVTRVVRGMDLLDSTPRQLWLMDKLGYRRPTYAHLPLLEAADGRRLSKRDQDLDMGALRERFTPAELTGYLAFLAGLTEEPAPASPRELVKEFTWAKVKRAPICIEQL